MRRHNSLLFQKNEAHDYIGQFMVGGPVDQESEETFDLEKRLKSIERMTHELVKFPGTYIGPYGTQIRDVDWFVLAAMKKTVSLTHAFCSLIQARNTLTAAALVRLHMDTALRIFGLTLVDDIEAAGTLLMNGGNYRDLRGRDKRKLHDKVLHEELNRHFPGLSGVYENTSSFVHLTAAHIKIGLKEVPHQPVLQFHLRATDDDPSDEVYEDIVDAFEDTTKLILELTEGFMQSSRGPNRGIKYPSTRHPRA